MSKISREIIEALESQDFVSARQLTEKALSTVALDEVYKIQAEMLGEEYEEDSEEESEDEVCPECGKSPCECDGEEEDESEEDDEDLSEARQKKSKLPKLPLPKGVKILPPIDRDEYPERAGLEGPFRFKSGRVLYYDPKQGQYYDAKTDIYVDKDELLEEKE